MTQQQWEILSLKVALAISIAGLLVFIIDYTRITKWAAWKDEIGQTILIKDVLMIGQTLPLLLAVFFKFSAIANRIAVWTLVVFYILVGLAMLWRTQRFERVHRRGKDRITSKERVSVSDCGSSNDSSVL